MKNSNFYYHIINSPIGKIKLYASDKALIGLFMEKEKVGKLHQLVKNSIQKKTTLLEKTEKELQLYFQNKLKKFSIPIELYGTDFQKTVWNELLKISHGSLRSYSEHATKIKNPAALRAVGSAIGSNPISIIVPCHRVIGKSGDLTGYAGGFSSKIWLIKHEGHTVNKLKVEL